MLRCAITDSPSYARDAPTQRAKLLEHARRWAFEGVELVQLREKHLEAGALFELAEAVLEILRANGPQNRSRTRLILNGRADVAAAAGADGVHLTSQSGELTPQQVRAVFAHAHRSMPIVSVSCHTLDEIRRAKDNGADYILFGPVFEKRVAGELIREGSGLDALRAACELADSLPVLALGGVTAEHAASCVAAGAAGVAGIRLFL
jgi:thiamine-phosphate pyrophosphorylase